MKNLQKKIDRRFPSMKLNSFRFAHHLIDEQNKVVYCYVAKNACSTIKFHFLRSLLESDGKIVSEHEINVNVHKWVRRYYFDPMRHDPNEIAEYYTFFITRDPLSRLLSAFCQKFIKGSAPPDFVVALMKKYGGENDHKLWTFESFVRAIAKSPLESLNEHWMPQSEHLLDFLSYNLIPMEGIDRHPHLADLFGSISGNVRAHSLKYSFWKDCSQRTPLSELKSIHRATGSMPSFHSLCSEELLSMIKEMYSADFFIYAQSKANSSHLSSAGSATVILR